MLSDASFIESGSEAGAEGKVEGGGGVRDRYLGRGGSRLDFLGLWVGFDRVLALRIGREGRWMDRSM